jgi:hypothetical protein
MRIGAEVLDDTTQGLGGVLGPTHDDPPVCTIRTIQQSSDMAAQPADFYASDRPSRTSAPTSPAEIIGQATTHYSRCAALYPAGPSSESITVDPVTGSARDPLLDRQP